MAISVPGLQRREEQAIFTDTKFLDRHQLNFPFSRLERELLFQIEQTWGFILSPDDIKLTFPDRHGRNILLPADMYAREFLDIHRPEWTREQDFCSHFLPRSFHRSKPTLCFPN